MGEWESWDGKTARFWVPGHPNLLSNDRRPWQATWKMRRQIKELAHISGEELRRIHDDLVLPLCYVVTQPYQSARGRACDAGALAPFTKSYLDGLVACGLLIDDDGLHISGETFLPPIRAGAQWRGVEIRLCAVKEAIRGST